MAIRRINADNSQDTQPTADAFINIRVQLSNGKTASLGKYGIALYGDKKLDKALISKFREDPEFADKLRENLVLSFVEVDAHEDDIEDLLDF